MRRKTSIVESAAAAATASAAMVMEVGEPSRTLPSTQDPREKVAK